MPARLASQFVVLGVHRSGTSLLSQTAIGLGLYGGSPDVLEGADQWNEQGYWEHTGVRAVNEELLIALDTDWMSGEAIDVRQIPVDTRARLEARAATIVRSLDENAPWVVKDPRLCLTLPFWLRHMPDAGAVFSLRHPVAVARSLQARDGFPMQIGLALWEAQMCAALRSAAKLPSAAFWYEDLLAKPREESERLAAWLRDVTGGKAGTSGAAPVGDPRLRHHVVDPVDERRLPDGTRRLLEALRTGEAFGPGFDAVASDDARELAGFLERTERTRRSLDAGWRQQQTAHRAAVALHEDMLKAKDAYIAELLRHQR